MNNRSFFRRSIAAAPLAALLGLALASAPARGAFDLGFSQANYVVDPGQVIDVPVYLTETGTTILNTEGLNGAGLVLSFNVPAFVSDPAQVTLITPNPANDPLLDFALTTIVAASPTTAGTAELLFSQFLSPPIDAGGTSQILIGKFQFTAGMIPGQVTNLELAVASPLGQFVTGTGTVLDTEIVGGVGTITVRGVPEPGSLMLLATCLPVLLRRLRRPRDAAEGGVEALAA